MPKNKYVLGNGTVVPGVTTIVNQLGKGDSLLNWAWECGKKGLDWKEERDSAGDIGTIVHEVISASLNDKPWDISSQPEDVKITVNRCLDKYIHWQLEQDFPFLPILTETPLVSERWRFGGQPDAYGTIGKRRVVVDVKTGGGIYDSVWYQLAGYDILLRENGYNPDEFLVLWLPKDDRFDAPIRTELKKEKQIFKHLLEIYKLRH